MPPIIAANGIAIINAFPSRLDPGFAPVFAKMLMAKLINNTVAGTLETKVEMAAEAMEKAKIIRHESLPALLSNHLEIGEARGVFIIDTDIP